MIREVGQIIQTQRFDVEVKHFDHQKITVFVRVHKDTDYDTQKVLNELMKRVSPERITRVELKRLVDDMFETGVFNSEQTYVNGASYQEHCVSYVVVPK